MDSIKSVVKRLYVIVMPGGSALTGSSGASWPLNRGPKDAGVSSRPGALSVPDKIWKELSVAPSESQSSHVALYGLYSCVGSQPHVTFKLSFVTYGQAPEGASTSGHPIVWGSVLHALTGGHGLQEAGGIYSLHVVPALGACVTSPLGHGLHIRTDVPGTEELYVPGTHLRQCVASLMFDACTNSFTPFLICSGLVPSAHAVASVPVDEILAAPWPGLSHGWHPANVDAKLGMGHVLSGTVHVEGSVASHVTEVAISTMLLGPGGPAEPANCPYGHVAHRCGCTGVGLYPVHGYRSKKAFM